MAVVACTEWGFVLDQTKFITKSFESTVVPLEYLPQLLTAASSPVENATASQGLTIATPSSCVSAFHRLSYKRDLFAIHVPFMMDSEFDALLRRLASKPIKQNSPSQKCSDAENTEYLVRTN
jgi:hypothetical protein